MATPEIRPADDDATWAETGDRGASGGAITTGWGASATPPSRQRFNWVLNKVHAIGRYLMHKGIPEYNVGGAYVAGDRVQEGGNTYVCILANNSAAPHAPPDATYWIRWGHTQAEIDARVAAVAAVTSWSFATSGITIEGGATGNVYNHNSVTITQGSTVRKTVRFLVDLNLTAGSVVAALALASSHAFPNGAQIAQITIAGYTGGIPSTPIVYGTPTAANTITVGVGGMGTCTQITLAVVVEGY